jgi:tRNA A22 N-methylase
LTAATEKTKTSINVHLDEHAGAIHEHVEKKKSHAGIIAGTVALGGAAIAGIIAKEHHDHKKEHVSRGKYKR